jgi:hypothetical protein
LGTTLVPQTEQNFCPGFKGAPQWLQNLGQVDGASAGVGAGAGGAVATGAAGAGLWPGGIWEASNVIDVVSSGLM